MPALLAISLWFALVTVIPGLVTVAAVYGAFVAVGRDELDVGGLAEAAPNDLVWLAVAIAAMVLTQAVGIVLEEHVLVPLELLGDDEIPVAWRGAGGSTIKPYEIYSLLYVHLAQLREADDPRGHVERAVAQLFLSVNTLVSFAAGIVAAIALFAADPGGEEALGAGAYSAALLAALAVTYAVVRSRFRLVARSIWAVEQARDEAPGADG